MRAKFCEYLEKRLILVEEIGKGFMEKLTFEWEFKRYVEHSYAYVVRDRRAGLSSKEHRWKVHICRSGNRKTQDMLNIATLGIEVNPKFYVLWKSKAFPKISANSEMASILFVKFDSKLQLWFLLLNWLVILPGSSGCRSNWSRNSHFPSFQ